MPGFVESLRRALGAGPRQGRALALLDLHVHTRGGHYGAWLRWFAGEFATRFDEVYVVTPEPRLTRALFDEAGAPANLSFHRLPRSLRRTFDLEALRGVGDARRRHLAAFVMWGYDLLDLAPPRAPGTVPWAALAGMSWLVRGHATPAAQMEERLQELFRSSPACRAFLQPDAYLDGAAEKAIWVPDVEDVSRPARPTPRAERIRAHAAGRFCVGTFGVITGYRCLHELLPLAREQPEVRFVVAGKVVEESVRAELRPLLADGALPNLLVLPEFIPTEEELNDAIAAADAVFIDGVSYPVQSGIVCKAVEAGRCVLTPRSNSWTSDFVLERGTGIVYESRTDPIAEAWARWKADGGPARSREASAAVRDPRAVAACFDGVTNELVKGMEPATS